MTKTVFIAVVLVGFTTSNVSATPPDAEAKALAAAEADDHERPSKQYTLAELHREREQLAQRKRRIVFNNDGDDLWKADGTREGILAARTTGLAGSHVDSIWYWGSKGFTITYQDGHFGKLYSTEKGKYYHRAKGPREKLMAECGKDNFEIMIDFCREQGLEIFYSNRMNDVHDSYFPGRLYVTKVEHPEWCLGTKEEAEKYGYPDPRSSWSAWNFEVPEIRRLTLAALREACQHYDIDGIELDFWRHLVNFPEMLHGKPVTPAHRELINQLLRDIRQMTEEEGLRRGRPILICGRMVEDVEVSKNSGLDVETWLEEDLVDLLSMAYGTEHAPPIDSVTHLAATYRVPVYPMINSYDMATFEVGASRQQRQGNLPVWRGDALNKYEQGAAGLQTFNLFEPDLRQFRELGEPELLLTLDRTYVWYYLPSQRKGRNTFGALRTTRHRWPVTITSAESESMPLYVGEDLASPDRSGKSRKLTLRVRARGLTARHGLIIEVNDTPLTPTKTLPELGEEPTVTWLHYDDLNGGLFQKGENAVTAAVKSEAGKPVEIDQVRLDVRY